MHESATEVIAAIAGSALLFAVTFPPALRWASSTHLLPRPVRGIPLTAAAALFILTAQPEDRPMAVPATIHEVDTDGDEFADQALYVDSYGDTWQYFGGIDEFLLVALVGQDAPLSGPNVIARFEEAQAVARDFGPMARVPGGRPCAECLVTAPAGRAYCSTRCHNAADRHDQDGDR
jgi:hypothetical protein